jgi:uncharacterized protein (TIGR03067 family)
MRLRTGFALTMAVCILMCDPRTQAAADELSPDADHAAIQGVWQLVYAETDGTRAPADQIRSIRVEIHEKTHSVFFDNKPVVHDVSYSIDPKASPRATDDTLNDGPDKGKQIHGIYELAGDTLVSCVAKIGAVRPKEFATKPGSDHTLRVFKRVRPDDGPKEKAIREELSKFGGSWTIAEMVIAGNSSPSENFKDDRLILQGDRFIWQSPGATTRGEFKVDPTASLKTIDLIFTDGSTKGQTLYGVYELTSDTYRVCISTNGKPRPVALESKPGQHQVLEVFKRERP